jgi:hypothetical protein
MTFFNVIAYRSNGYDTCRGQVMDSTDSECSVFNSTDINETATRIAELRFSETISSRATNSYEISVIINGICIRDEIDSNWFDYNTEQYDEVYDIIEELEAIAAVSLVAIKNKHVCNEALAKEAKIKADAEAEQARIAAAKAKIIDDYHKLMDDYNKLKIEHN